MKRLMIPHTLLLLPFLTILLTIPVPAQADILVTTNGNTATGAFLSLDTKEVHFHTNDGRTIDVDRKEVFGVFADDAPKKLLKPASDVKGEIRIGSSSIKGQIMLYDPRFPFLFYSDAGKAKVARVRTEDKLQHLRIGPTVPLDQIDRGSAFGRDVLRTIKAASKDDILIGILIGEQYLKLGPSGNERAEVELLMGTLRKSWKEKVKEYFKVVSAQVSNRSDTKEPMLTYHIYSKNDTFTGLNCRIWVQLADDAVLAAKFTYYTLRKSNRHHDTVQVNNPAARIKKWRILLEYHGEVACVKESEPSGPEGWWKEAGADLSFWGVEERDQKEASDAYFSRTLGKATLDSE